MAPSVGISNLMLAASLVSLVPCLEIGVLFPGARRTTKVSDRCRQKDEDCLLNLVMH